MSNWKVILATIAIFAAGALAGGTLAWKLVSDSKEERRFGFDPRRMRHDYVERLERDLQLSPAQKTEISEILSNSHARVQKIFEDWNPKMRQEMEQVRASIRAVLTPEQQETFEELRNRRHHHRKEWHRDKSHKRGRDEDRYRDQPNGESREADFPPASPKPDPTTPVEDDAC